MGEIVDDRTTTPLLAHPQNTATAVTHLHSPNVAETTHVDPPTDIRRRQVWQVPEWFTAPTIVELSFAVNVRATAIIVNRRHNVIVIVTEVE